MNLTKNYVLFLTGCIDPNGMSYTVLQNSEIRKSQYIETIKFYLNETNLKILFVENSGNDISDIFIDEIKSKRVEILTFVGNNYDRILGKGYGEMLIIEYAILHSEFLSHSDFVYKITGRYKILNISSFIINYLGKDVDLLLNFRPCLTWADSRFFGFKPFFLQQYLLVYKEIVNDQKSINFENALSKASLDLILDNRRYERFCKYPRYCGTIGTTGKKYNDSYFYWIYKATLLKIMRIIQHLLQVN